MKSKPLTRARHVFRPRLEVLEDRTAPAVFTVTTPIDVVNSADDDLSFREAIIGANNNPGPDTIAFNILGPGVQTITIVGPALPNVTDTVVIDGYTQPGSAPNTNPIDQSSNAVILIELVSPDFPRDGLILKSDGNTVRGLTMSSFGTAIYVTSSNNIIAGNYLGTNAAGTTAIGNARGVHVNQTTAMVPVNNTIGGLNPADRNVIVGGTIPGSIGILTQWASSLTVLGNFIGTSAGGTTYLGLGNGVDLVNSTNSVVGGTHPQARNVIAGNGVGVNLGTGTNGTTIQGNFIGVDRTGTAGLDAGASSSNGVRADTSASNNLIGGSAAGAGNVIGDYGIGIHVAQASARHTIQGNRIGTDVTGTLNLGNSFAGIVLANPGTSENLIGGTNAGEGNTIANNGAGIVVGSGGFGAILGNSIYGNAPTAAQPSGLGIDLLPNSGQTGPTLNDLGDGDTAGGNNFQNFPVLTSAVIQGGTTIISGTFNSTPGERFRIEFFSSAAADASGFGEGQSYLGFVEVVTDASGNASFQSNVNATPAGQSVITATATWLFQLDAGGFLPWSTSEFSATIATTSGNSAPQAANAQAVTDEDNSKIITLSATDADADEVTIQIVTGPLHGTLGPIGEPTYQMVGGICVGTAQITYTPNPDYNGEDSFSFRVNDGQADSNLGTIQLSIRPVNDRPSASSTPTSLSVRANSSATPVRLQGADLETPAVNLSFRITTVPLHGTLRHGANVLQTSTTFSGSPADVTYIPQSGYSGPDEFRFATVDRGDPDNSSAVDGYSPSLESSEIIVPITVRPVEPPSVTVDDAFIAEGHAGTRTLFLTVTVSDLGTSPIEIAVATAQATATAGKDYYSVARILRFPVGGPTSQQVAIRIIGERLVEADESFVLNILSAKGAAIADGQGVATIINDDAQPTISISDAAFIQRQGYVEAVFSIRLSGPTYLPISVVFRTADGTALAGLDYRALTQTLAFRPGGSLVQQVRVRVFGQPNRTFFARLTDVNNTVVTRGEGLGLIV